MNLIAYSDSEESDSEAPQAPKPAAKPAPKPSFQKVVDRSQPGKIKLNLPTPSQGKTEKDDIESEAPPAKKARTGGGAFSGFNSMLPAPKKPNVSTAPGGAISASRGPGKALGKGISLKTGAEPVFQRSSNFDEDYDENGNPVRKEDTKPKTKDDFRALLNLPPPKTESKATDSLKPVSPAPTLPITDVKPAAKPRFMPLSVARGKKKRPAASRADAPAAVESKAPSSSVATPPPVDVKPAGKPKVSLFSVSQDTKVESTMGTSGGDYQPLLYGAEDDADTAVPDEVFESSFAATAQGIVPAANQSASTAHGLTNIASELNLTEAQRRQLFGRKGHGPDPSAANIIEFNTDTEYAHNERLRQQGETVQHNALKSISGTGKNSLKSLISNAVTQKDAHEEHFATGRRNKREAGNKYGW